MTWVSLKRYLREHWRGFVSSSAFGASTGTFLTPWILRQNWARSALESHNPRLPYAVLLLTAALLVPTWPGAVKLWRRYCRTQALELPPLQHADLIATGTLTAILAAIVVIYTDPTRPTNSEAANIAVLGSLFLLSLWTVGSLLWSRRPEIFLDVEVEVRQHEGDYADDPITSDDQDLLGRIPFVDRLLNQILSLPSPNSFVFGLHGTWGDGKTSVLKLLQQRLAKDENVITIAFNPWYFADQTALVQAFYGALEKELQTRYILSGLHRTIKRYKDLLTSGLRYLGVQLPVKDDPERLRSELESWIYRINCRLVIIIDDIDRLQPDEMLAVFKLPRLSARLPNTLFLLSFDNLVVSETLKNQKVEAEFLDKIIQKPVPLPRPEQRDIDRFLFFSDPIGPEAHRSGIDRLLDELQTDSRKRKVFDEEMELFYQTCLRRLFRTIRQAKRYLNVLRATLPPIVDEVNLFDFFLLEALQVFFPKIYKDIWNNPWVYLPPWSQEIFLVHPFGLITDENERYQRIQEHVQKLLDQESQKEVAREILEKVFFVEIKNAFRRMEDPITTTTRKAIKQISG